MILDGLKKVSDGYVNFLGGILPLDSQCPVFLLCILVMLSWLVVLLITPILVMLSMPFRMLRQCYLLRSHSNIIKVVNQMVPQNCSDDVRNVIKATTNSKLFSRADVLCYTFFSDRRVDLFYIDDFIRVRTLAGDQMDVWLPLSWSSEKKCQHICEQFNKTDTSNNAPWDHTKIAFTVENQEGTELCMMDSSGANCFNVEEVFSDPNSVFQKQRDRDASVTAVSTTHRLGGPVEAPGSVNLNSTESKETEGSDLDDETQLLPGSGDAANDDLVGTVNYSTLQ